ncbi:hypothetical protein ACQEVB_32745 [Pseudonocardia sp. CA-107938]|uniref:hypothetical protein n=1 Tax=Pseudonocardia sp. CA-107938 TaxID=3240021 RepID=UPI003D90CE39
MIVAGGVLAIVPASRGYLLDRMWCGISRHRIRAALTGSRLRTMTRNGRLPLLLWSRPSPVGERVRVWLPAGMSVNDLDRMTDEFATACWAREVRIIPSRAQAAMAVIEVVRRDPLAASRPLTPVLISDLSVGPVPGPTIERETSPDTSTDRGDRTIRPLPDRGTIIIPKVAPPVVEPTGTTSPRPSISGPTAGQKDTSTPDKPTEPPISGFGGMDVTDYI